MDSGTITTGQSQESPLAALSPEQLVIREKVYQQDCEFVRHQNSLMWNRFQTITTMEAAWLYALFGVNRVDSLLERSAIAIVGGVVIAIVGLLSFRDAAIRQAHQNRAAEFENLHENVEIPSWRLNSGSRSYFFTGRFARVLIFTILTLFNVAVIILLSVKSS